MIPVQGLALEEDGGEDGEDDEGDDFLDDLELHEGERTAVAVKADAVGRNLAHVFKEGDAPAKGYHADEGKGIEPAEGLFHFQVAVPGKGHKDVRNDEETNGHECFHIA